MTYVFIYGTFIKGKSSQKGGIVMANVKTDRKPLFGNSRSHALNATKKKQGLFLGGYIFCKNTLDYRAANKNKKYFNNNINYKKEDNNIHVSCIKVRNRERVRVRKK